jgi:hypothetical protein
MINYGYVFAAILMCSPSAADKQAHTVERLFEVMKAKSPTIEDLEQIFGEDGYAELFTLLEIYFPNRVRGVVPLPDAPEVAFTRKRLADRKGASEFLACIRRLKPSLFKPAGRLQISGNLATAADPFVRRAVETQAGKLVVVFEPGASVIEDLEMPDGKSISTLIPSCGGERKEARP